MIRRSPQPWVRAGCRTDLVKHRGGTPWTQAQRRWSWGRHIHSAQTMLRWWARDSLGAQYERVLLICACGRVRLAEKGSLSVWSRPSTELAALRDRVDVREIEGLGDQGTYDRRVPGVGMQREYGYFAPPPPGGWFGSAHAASTQPGDVPGSRAVEFFRVSTEHRGR